MEWPTRQGTRVVYIKTSKLFLSSLVTYLSLQATAEILPRNTPQSHLSKSLRNHYSYPPSHFTRPSHNFCRGNRFVKWTNDLSTFVLP
jgi:hypothetical protein